MAVLTRDAFRVAVLARDGGKCVICGTLAADAHHLIERRLFAHEGYGNDPDNGASLCATHHLDAERTLLSPEDLRASAHIQRLVLPEHFYEDEVYDKWGNILRPDGSRSPGELFWDESVQKALREGGVLGRFRPYIRHPRTYHLPWSPGATRDDRTRGHAMGANRRLPSRQRGSPGGSLHTDAIGFLTWIYRMDRIKAGPRH